MMFYFEHTSPIGPLLLAEEDGALRYLLFSGLNDARIKREAWRHQETPLLTKTAHWLDGYFAGARAAFALPLKPKGTPFQQSVWNALCAIPYGETRTYAQIAAKAGSPKGYRAAGMANNRNPIAVIIPCHRVIGADGSLTGYAGGLGVKRHLLALEGALY